MPNLENSLRRENLGTHALPGTMEQEALSHQQGNFVNSLVVAMDHPCSQSFLAAKTPVQQLQLVRRFPSRAGCLASSDTIIGLRVPRMYQYDGARQTKRKHVEDLSRPWLVTALFRSARPSSELLSVPTPWFFLCCDYALCLSTLVIAFAFVRALRCFNPMSARLLIQQLCMTVPQGSK